ncbi:hypothetical protein ACX800_16690 [Paenarthrobacter nitroguajacolicus]|uniref:hypothetical protein n=1 Tax=Paenarthrobacter nitroguajacolicus TaxID=211146 RepID=UPI003D1C1E90
MADVADPGTNRALGRAQGKLTPAVHDGRGEYVTAIQNRHETKEARSEVMGELTQGNPDAGAKNQYNTKLPGFAMDVCNYSHWLEWCGYEEHPRAISALGSYVAEC